MAIDAREKPVPRNHAAKLVKKRHRGRPKEETERIRASSRLEQRSILELGEMLGALPKDCTVGCKRSANGHTQRWTGYKLRMDTADSGVPISCLVTSALLHDRQGAMPLARSTVQRVDNCHDLIDSAYDTKEIAAHRRGSTFVPIIDPNQRKKKVADCREQKAQRSAGLIPAERVRCRKRSTAERAFGRLNEELSGRNIRLSGLGKVLCHQMFSVVVLAADHSLRIVQ